MTVLRLLAVAGVCLGSGAIALAQSSLPAPHNGTFQLEESLFVQDPHLSRMKGGIQVLWIPEPIQKYCLGKTGQQCSAIDFCIRTTTKSVAMCRNLTVDLTRMPAYPPGMRPRRLLSVVYFPLAPAKGFGALLDFFQSAPKDWLDRLSTRARIKARIQLTRTADDDQFDLMEVLAVPSLEAF
jgi:hypothetical protein